MKAFIGWSGQRGLALAEAVRAWLAQVLPELPAFVSIELPKGRLWFPALAQELKSARVGLMCLAPPRVAGDWQLVESGAIWKATARGSLFPLCFCVERSRIPDPLQAFQVTEFERSEFRALGLALAELAGADRARAAEVGLRADAAWPAFEIAVQQALRVPDDAVHETRGFVHEVCGGWWERVHSAQRDTRLSWMWFTPGVAGASLTIAGRGFDATGNYASEWRTELVAVDARPAEPVLTYFWEGRRPNDEPQLLFGGKCTLRFEIGVDGRIERGGGEFADMCLNPREAAAAQIRQGPAPTLEIPLRLAPTVKTVDLLRARPDEVAVMRGTDVAARRALVIGKLGAWD